MNNITKSKKSLISLCLKALFRPREVFQAAGETRLNWLGFFPFLVFFSLLAALANHAFLYSARFFSLPEDTLFISLLSETAVRIFLWLAAALAFHLSARLFRRPIRNWQAEAGATVLWFVFNLFTLLDLSHVFGLGLMTLNLGDLQLPLSWLLSSLYFPVLVYGFLTQALGVRGWRKLPSALLAFCLLPGLKMIQQAPILLGLSLPWVENIWSFSLFFYVVLGYLFYVIYSRFQGYSYNRIFKVRFLRGSVLTLIKPHKIYQNIPGTEKGDYRFVIPYVVVVGFLYFIPHAYVLFRNNLFSDPRFTTITISQSWIALLCCLLGVAFLYFLNIVFRKKVPVNKLEEAVAYLIFVVYISPVLDLPHFFGLPTWNPEILGNTVHLHFALLISFPVIAINLFFLCRDLLGLTKKQMAGALVIAVSAPFIARFGVEELPSYINQFFFGIYNDYWANAIYFYGAGLFALLVWRLAFFLPKKRYAFYLAFNLLILAAVFTSANSLIKTVPQEGYRTYSSLSKYYTLRQETDDFWRELWHSEAFSWKTLFGFNVAWADAFACDSGSLDTTCYVTSDLSIGADETVSGTGTLVIEGGIFMAGSSTLTLNMDTAVKMKSGCLVKGNMEASTTDFYIYDGAFLTAQGKGYGGGVGSENGQGSGGGSYARYGGGAGYGGVGGNGSSGSNAGSTYGSSTAPDDFGSGGGGGFFSDKYGDDISTGGSGGGRVKIYASDMVLVNGLLDANGMAGEVVTGAEGASASGGGSGGSVWIKSDIIYGTGTISVLGGDGGEYNDSSFGGGGGGGRISLDANVLAFYGALSAGGGNHGAAGGTTNGDNSTTSDYIYVSGDMTIDSSTTTEGIVFLENSSLTIATTAELTVNDFVTINNTNRLYNHGEIIYGGRTLVTSNFDNYGTTTLSDPENLIVNGTFSNYGILSATNTSENCSILLFDTWNLGGDYEIGTTCDMKIFDNALLTHVANSCVFENYIDLALRNLKVYSGGAVNVNYKGYSGYDAYNGCGPGGGAGSFGSGAGAGYGGAGSLSENLSHENGDGYGSAIAPIDPGSAGGGTDGGSGGGVVILDISDTLILEEDISANGAGASTGEESGGGSGGSVYIKASTATGTGSILANGGNGSTGGDYYGGGGAGGRIALYIENNYLTGSTTAYGGRRGDDNASAGAGTIYRKKPSQANGNLSINNQGSVSPERVISSTSPTVIENFFYNELSTSFIIATGTSFTIQQVGDFELDVYSGGTVNNSGGLYLPNITGYVYIGGNYLSAGTTSLPNADYLTVEGYFRNNQSFSGNSVYSFEVGGSFVNTATASLPVATSTILGGFTNTGYFSASNSLVFSVGTTTNSGTVILDSLTDLDAAAPFTNSGTFTANGLATLTMSSDFTNTGTMNLPGLSELVLDGGTFSFDGTWNLPDTYDMTINSGGTLTHAENHDTHENDLVLTLNNLTINQGGRINVNGKGYSGGIGNSEDGHGPGGGGVWFGGAGHGGLGGDCDANNNGGAEYGSTTAPTALGSGGVAYSSRDGKAGGGAIKMDISDTFTFNGNITANGVDGIYSSDYHPGGGAGGSIWISANIATGTGEITANGGNGSQYMGSYRSGAGAGGRIALYFDTDNFTGTTTAYGGAGCDNIYGGAGSIYRKSGSQTYGDLVIDNQGNVSPERIFSTTSVREVASFDYNEIPKGFTIGTSTSFTAYQTGDFELNVSGNTIVNSGGLYLPNIDGSVDFSTTFINSGSIVLPKADSLSINNNYTNNGNAVLTDLSNLFISGNCVNTGTTSMPNLDSFILGGNMNLDEGVYELSNDFAFTLLNGANVTCNDNTTSKENWIELTLGSLEIQSGATMQANYKGFAGANSGHVDGYGTGGGAYGYRGGGGGGYGGVGGDGYNGNGGSTYGTSSAPTGLGSGGGYSDQHRSNDGGDGGGSIRLVVSGEVTVDGVLEVNGEDAGYSGDSYAGGGGGSGGSIWVEAGTFSGSGEIHADGGDGGYYNSTYYGGGGGGGRIKLDYDNFNFTGTITADQGVGWQDGQEGVIILPPEPLYRSVGYDSRDLNSIGATATIGTTTAVFSGDLPLNVGVGDAIVYTAGSGATEVAFIKGRESADTFAVQAGNGAFAATSTAGTGVSIYRSYLTLNDWQTQVESDVNPSILEALRSDVTVGKDLVGSSKAMYVACYGSSTPDVGGVSVDGWTTGTSTLISIFTPDDRTRVGVSQRHTGRWDQRKYRLEATTTAINIKTDFVNVVGLQIALDAATSSQSGITISGSSLGNYDIKQNIIRADSTSESDIRGFSVFTDASDGFVYAFNNIIYDFAGSGHTGILNTGSDAVLYAFHNTVYNCTTGINREAGDLIAYNNITRAADDGYAGTFEPLSDYNLSDIAGDAPNSTFTTAASYPRFRDETNRDLHLDHTDTTAKDRATSTIADFGLADIDNQHRLYTSQTEQGSWDIGADEASVPFASAVRASGGDFSLLSTWENANQVDLAATTTAVFSCNEVNGALPIGSSVIGAVSGAQASTTIMSSASGQILLYNITGTGFQKSEKVYLKGGSPDSNYCVLADYGNPAIAEARISGYFSDPDMTAVAISGWNTGHANYIWINSLPLDGQAGKWEERRYRLSVPSRSRAENLLISEDHVRVSGLQIRVADAYDSGGAHKDVGIGLSSLGLDAEIYIENSLIHGNTVGNSAAGSEYAGVRVADNNDDFSLMAANNIIYGFTGEAETQAGIQLSGNGNYYLYNNTFYNNLTGLAASGFNTKAINNLAQNCGDGYSGFFADTSDYNLSDLAGDAPGVNAFNSQSVIFQNTGGHNYRLALDDNTAKDSGTDSVFYDKWFSVFADAEGTRRGAGVDIGADEVPADFTSLIRQTGGDHRSLALWESAVQTDLASGTTRVFSGSLTGNLSRGATVILRQDGVDTAITATVAATSTGQLLISGITNMPEPYIVSDADQWRADGSNYFTVSGANDQLGASARAVASIDGEWTGSDSSPFAVDGWSTDADNYVLIKTTDTARHDGMWTQDAYILSATTTAVILEEPYTRIKGIQIALNPSDVGRIGIDVNAHSAYLAYNLVAKNAGAAGANSRGIDLALGTLAGDSFVYNNIVYDFDRSGDVAVKADGATRGKHYVYANTLVDNTTGLESQASTTEAINNLLQGNTTGFAGTFATTSGYNLSEDSTAPGNNSVTDASVLFRGEDIDDFHLDSSDSYAVDAGTDLYLSDHLSVEDDIDNSSRPVNVEGALWDIGADEIGLAIYRSVGPGRTGAIAQGSPGQPVTVDRSARTATFAAGLPPDAGIGDVVVYNNNTSLGVIHERLSATEFTLVTVTGGAPDAANSDGSWSVYRAYTSLNDALRGQENAGIPVSLRDFDEHGLDHDTYAANETWYLACYGDGIDTEPATIIWGTHQDSPLTIFAPTEPNEVGVSQKHSGVWGQGYRLEAATSSALTVNSPYVTLRGLSISVTGTGDFSAVDLASTAYSSYLADSLLAGNGDGQGVKTSASSTTVYNTVAYDFNDAFLSQADGPVSIYNSTAYGSAYGFRTTGLAPVLVNTLAQKCADGYSGTWSQASDYNLSDIAGDAPNDTFAGSPGKARFKNPDYGDYRLSGLDTTALDQGTSSPASNPLLRGVAGGRGVSYDIDGDYRRSWDIGADEATIELVSTISETDGDFTSLAVWEQTVQAPLAATTTAVFTCSDSDGVIPAGTTVIGSQSGAIASSTVLSTTTNQILLYNLPATGSFQSGERVYIQGQGSGSNYCDISDQGNPAALVARIDGSWTGADTNAVDVSGWTTDASNYIRIFTTDSARHIGKWDDTAYRLAVTADSHALVIQESFVTLEGLQVSSPNQASRDGVSLVGTGNRQLTVQGCIIKGANADGAAGIRFGATAMQPNFAYNNIIYDYAGADQGSCLDSGAQDGAGGNWYYNNTAYNCRSGLSLAGGVTGYARNNLVQNTGTAGYSGAFSNTSGNNLSSDNTAPGTYSITNATVRFVNLAGRNLHLHTDDRVAVDLGTSSISQSPNFQIPEISYDIDGTARGAAFDIGADEVPAAFESTICENTSAGGDCANLDYTYLAEWEDAVETDLAATTTRVFSGTITGSLNENDLVEIWRNSTTTNMRGYVVATTSDQILVDGIFEELNSSATEELSSSKPLVLQDGDQLRMDGSNYWTVSGTGDSLGASARAEAKIDGAWANPDTEAVTIQDWGTDRDNYVKIYTTDLARHNGKWDTTAYRIEDSNRYYGLIYNRISNTRIDGLQLSQLGTWVDGGGGIFHNENRPGEQIYISNNIIRHNGPEPTAGSRAAIMPAHYANDESYIWNNIIYGFRNGIRTSLIESGARIYVYNNTVSDCIDRGIHMSAYPDSSAYYYLKNNLVINSGSSDYSYAFNENLIFEHSNNISSDGTSPDSELQSQTVDFISTASGTEDFHLTRESAARNAGADLFDDPYLNVRTDIDGEARGENAFDIGADEYIGGTGSGGPVDSDSTVETVDLEDGLAGHWKFNAKGGSAVADLSGQGNGGTWIGSGSHWTGEGWYGSGGYLNGQDDYVFTGLQLGGEDAVTFSAWLKFDVISSNQYILGAWGNNQNALKLSLAGSADELKVCTASSTTDSCTNYAETTDADISVNKWYNIQVVYDGSAARPADRIQILVNGRAQDMTVTGTIPTALPNAGSFLKVGGNNDTGEYLKAYIDDMHVYSRALNSRELAMVFSGAGTAVEWNFRNTLKDSGKLCQGDSGLCQNLSGTGSWDFGTSYLEEGAAAVRLNGSTHFSTYQDTYYNVASSGDMAVVATVKTSDTDNSVIISKRSSEAAADAGWLFGLDFGQGDGVPYFEASDGSSEFAVYGNSGIADGKWHTIAAVFDQDSGANCKIYIDGTPATGGRTGSISALGSLRNSEDLNIGRTADGNNYLTASIDRIAFMPFAAARSEILRENAGGSSMRSGHQKRDRSIGIDWDPFGGTAPVAWWKLDEMKGDTAKDYASSSLDGTWSGSGDHHVVGKIGMAGQFNGVDDQINVPHCEAINLNDAYTYTAWVRFDNVVGSVDGLISKNESQWSIHRDNSGGDIVDNKVKINVTHNDVDYGVGWIWPYQELFHFAASWDGSQVKLYLNGQLNDTLNISGTLNTGTADLILGFGERETGQNGRLEGIMDDVRIYDYARSHAQVMWDYNTGKPVGHWKFDDASSGSADGASILDSSGNGLSGMGDDGANNSGLAWTAGKFGNALEFDGDDDFVELGDANDLEGFEQITVSAWVYNDTSDDFQEIIKKDGVYALDISFSGKYRFEIWSPTSNILLSDIDMITGRWVHLAGVYDGSRQYLYIDGELATSTPASGTINTTTNPLRFGKHSDSDPNTHNGKLDDIRIYNYARTPDQIRQDYNGGARLKYGD